MDYRGIPSNFSAECVLIPTEVWKYGVKKSGGILYSDPTLSYMFFHFFKYAIIALFFSGNAQLAKTIAHCDINAGGHASFKPAF
jgi:hypothetical protein